MKKNQENMKPKQQQKRATFQDVGQSQDLLRQKIDDLIKENRPLTTQEREAFIHNFREATLGFGANHIFKIAKQGKSYSIGSVGHAALWISYRETNPVVMTDGISIEIKELWKELRLSLFTVFDEAVHLSVKISQEQIHVGPSKAGTV